jgi:hypothetical protein
MKTKYEYQRSMQRCLNNSAQDTDEPPRGGDSYLAALEFDPGPSGWKSEALPQIQMDTSVGAQTSKQITKIFNKNANPQSRYRMNDILKPLVADTADDRVPTY